MSPSGKMIFFFQLKSTNEDTDTVKRYSLFLPHTKTRAKVAPPIFCFVYFSNEKNKWCNTPYTLRDALSRFSWGKKSSWQPPVSCASASFTSLRLPGFAEFILFFNGLLQLGNTHSVLFSSCTVQRLPCFGSPAGRHRLRA
jgi:hypothetical protein